MCVKEPWIKIYLPLFQVWPDTMPSTTASSSTTTTTRTSTITTTTTSSTSTTIPTTANFSTKRLLNAEAIPTDEMPAENPTDFESEADEYDEYNHIYTPYMAAYDVNYNDYGGDYENAALDIGQGTDT